MALYWVIAGKIAGITPVTSAQNIGIPHPLIVYSVFCSFATHMKRVRNTHVKMGI